jgi:hypothetical protein
MSQGSGPQIVDFNQARAQKMEEKRRKAERVFFKNVLGVYSVMGRDSLQPIEFVDVSEHGCSFQVPFSPARAWPAASTEVPLRIYFTKDSYLEIRVQIQNSRHTIEDGSRFVRFGCAIDQTTSAYSAYVHFVRFLKSYSEECHKDTGDHTVFYL